MSLIKRVEIPKAILSVTILIMVTSFYLTPKEFTDLGNYLKGFVVVMGSAMLGLGFINVLMIHIPRISKKQAGEWYLSLVTIVSILTMFFLCATNAFPGGVFSQMYSFAYQTVMYSLDSAVYSISAFFTFTAVWRAMRLKTYESGAFTVAHIFAVLTNAPIGAVIWTGIPIIGNWINQVVMSAGLRGFIICSSLGAIILTFRYLIGKSDIVLGGARRGRE